MNRTKEAIHNFVAKSGHHETTVHGKVAPSVQYETVKPTQHENINTAIDKEIHQDHYHTTIQPIQDKQVLQEKHHHKVGAVEHREFDHRNHDNTKRALATENQKFHDQRVVNDTIRTQSNAPVVVGERVHHHVHEVIQPVIHKETIEPHVVHTTVPIHEVHHNSAKHHSASTLEPVSMAEFKKNGGVLSGREERVDHFNGVPQNIDGLLPSENSSNSTHQEGLSNRHSKLANDTNSRPLNENAFSLTNGSKTENLSSPKGRKSVAGEVVEQKKSGGLLNKLNPKTDSTGDGIAGFMK